MLVNPFFEMLNYMYGELLKGKAWVHKTEIEAIFKKKGIPIEHIGQYDFLEGTGSCVGSFFATRLHDSAYYGIKCEGISYVTSYIELQEARKNARVAIWIAIASFILATIVGGAQIYIACKGGPDSTPAQQVTAP